MRKIVLLASVALVAIMMLAGIQSAMRVDKSSEQPTLISAGLNPNNITTRVYDMFNVPLGNWWGDRYQEEIIHNASPYTYMWYGAPAGNTAIYSDYRMNVTARNVVNVNSTENPWYVPILSPTVRGGNINLNWTANYITKAEAVADYPKTISDWYDSWFWRWNGTVTMDQTAAKMVLNMTDTDFNNFAIWKASNFFPFEQKFSQWVTDQMNLVWAIKFANTYGGITLYELYDIQKVGNSIVFQILDHLSWGGESLFSRWWSHTFMEFEGWPEDVHFTASIGPIMSDLNLDTAIQYGLVAQKSTRDGGTCWVFENSHADNVQGSYGSYESEFNPYIGKSFWNLRIANAGFGTLTQYDYTPWAWNLSANEELIIDWPSSNQIIGYNFSGTNDFSDNFTGEVYPLWIEPLPTEIPDNMKVDQANRSITITGPLDVWSWSKNSASITELQANWTRLGILPHGCPFIEFVVATGVFQTKPNAAFTTSPLAGTLATHFDVDASPSSDAEDQLSSLIVRWDWESDGAWDTAWAKVKTATHQYSSEGIYNITLEVMDSGGLTDTITHSVAVNDITPPVTSVSLSGTIGKLGWYISPVNVTISAVDPVGISWTRYRIDSGNWLNYSSKVVISADGIHLFEFRSQDTYGNTEVARKMNIMIDCIAPVTNVTVIGTKVTLIATDAASGVNMTWVGLDGGSLQYYTGAFNVTATGNHTIDFYSIDFAGNIEHTRTTWLDNGAGGIAGLPVEFIGIILLVAVLLVIALFLWKRKTN